MQNAKYNLPILTTLKTSFSMFQAYHSFHATYQKRAAIMNYLVAFLLSGCVVFPRNFPRFRVNLSSPHLTNRRQFLLHSSSELLCWSESSKRWTPWLNNTLRCRHSFLCPWNSTWEPSVKKQTSFPQSTNIVWQFPRHISHLAFPLGCHKPSLCYLERFGIHFDPFWSVT